MLDLTAQETNEQLPEGEAPPPTGMDNRQASDNKVPPTRRGKDDEEAAVRRFHVAASNFLQPLLRRFNSLSIQFYIYCRIELRSDQFQVHTNLQVFCFHLKEVINNFMNKKNINND